MTDLLALQAGPGNGTLAIWWVLAAVLIGE